MKSRYSAKTPWAVALVASVTLALSGCGGSSGGGGGSSAPTLSGTAAVGAAIVGGTVTARCSDGSTFTQTVTTDANGNWSGTLNSGVLPCALRVTGGTPPDTLYSYASTTGTVNITPLTTLALAQATNQQPADWFAAFDGTPVDVNTAADEVLDALNNANFDLPPTGNPFTTPFAADGTGWDGLLDDLKQAITDDPALADLDALVTLVKDGNLATAVPDAPPPPSYQVSGTIAGANGSLIWEIRVDGFIRNDGGSSNGPVTFTSLSGLEEGSNWSVVINTPPAGQTCNVANGTGTLTADVTNVAITCEDIVVPPTTYSISGTISGASGAVGWETRIGAAAFHSGSNGNGAVTFTPVTEMEEDSSWSVIVTSAPAGQTCNVSNGSGTLTADVTNVAITCEDIVVPPTTYTISGTISGASASVQWETRVGGAFYHDGSNGNGAVTFTPLEEMAANSSWSVVVTGAPSGQTCNVSNGSGTLTADVTNVAITCEDIVVPPTTYSISGTISGASASVQWETRVGGAFYHDGSNGNGAVTFTPLEEMAADSSWSVVVTGAPAGQTCNVSNGSGTLTADVTNVAISCANGEPEPAPLYDFSALNLQPSVPLDMVPTPPAGVPTNPATEIEGLFLQLGAAERAKIFAPAPIDRSTVVNSVYSTSQTYEVLERTADNSWLRQVTMMFGADGEPNTADDSVAAYTVYPYGQLGVAYSFIHPGPDAIWFTEDDVAGVHNLGKMVYFPNGALLEYEGASEGAVLIIPCLDPGTDGLPFSADDKPGCSLGYQVAVLDGADNRGQVVTYDAAGPDGLWFTADDRVKNYTLVTYNGTGVGVASVLYNGDGADNIWFTADDDVQLHTLTKLGDDFKPRYTATYNNRGVDSTWFTADDVVQSWTYYGYDANGNNILVATHTSKGGDGIWFTADDSATATISLKDDNGYPMLSGQITSGGMGPDGRWLSGDETLFGYTYNEYNDAGLQTRTVTMQSSGPDGKWFTADDQPGLYGNYWIRELTPDNRVQKQIYFDASLSPGARAFSDAHRSRYTVYSPDFSTSVSVYRDQYGSSFGADGEPFTEDDIIGWPYSVTTPTGLDQFNQPGPDGTWFTADDVRSNYVVYSYDGLRRTEQRFDANDSMISYTEIVPISASSYRLNSYSLDEFDALVLNSYSIIDEDINGYPLVTTYYDLSDMITNVEYTERDADGNIIRQGWSYSPGNDGIWATSDDYSYYALYFFNMSGEQIASGMERVGPDGIWGTEDDTISIDTISQLEYDLDVLALNGGVNADTCGTLLSGLGASGDINLLVRDQNGAPLSGVIAQLGANGSTVTTDANGEAAFVGLSGTQDVHLFKDGYAWESFYCVAPGLDVTLQSKLASLSVAADSSKVSFYIEPTNKNVTLRLLDAQGKSVAARSLSTSSGAEAGTTYGDLLFDLPAGSEVSGELWVFEVDYSSGRLVSAQSLGQQTYTTIPWNSYPTVQDREQITVSLPTSDLVPVAFDGSLVQPHGAGFGTFGVSLDDLFVLPFNYESALGDSAAMAPGVDVTLPATAQPSAVVAYTSIWTARYPGVFPEIGNGTFVASIITGFQYGPVVTGQSDSSATPTLNWIPASQKDSAAFLSANTVELHSAAGGIGYQSHWTIHTPPGESQVTLPSLPAGITGPALPESSYRFVFKAHAVPSLGYHELIATQDLRNLDPALAREMLTTGDPFLGPVLQR